MTDFLVRQAQNVFLPVHTQQNDGYVSFELDPLLEDPACPLAVADKAKRYVDLGKKWAAGHTNRMIKVPATPGGLAALEELAASGVTLNVTLIFSHRQYDAARAGDLARGAATQIARQVQVGLQHLHQPHRRLYEAPPAAVVAGRQGEWASST